MKTILSLCLALFAFTAHAQKITIPVDLQLSFELPEQTNSGNVVWNITTNIVVTNIFITNITTNTYVITTNSYSYVTNIVSGGGVSKLVPMTDDIIDPRKGSRLLKLITGPTTFTTSSFAQDAITTLYFINPQRHMMTFPPQAVWMGGVVTNQVRGAILIENVVGQLWLTP